MLDAIRECFRAEGLFFGHDTRENKLDYSGSARHWIVRVQDGNLVVISKDRLPLCKLTAKRFPLSDPEVFRKAADYILQAESPNLWARRQKQRNS